VTTSGDGRLIAAIGLPGSGKSAVFRDLAELVSATLFAEPEEGDWGAAVQEREMCGYFTGLMWFRSERVPNYFRAHEVARSGGVALLDTYYDKLCAKWLGRPGMEWLLDPEDPYFPAAKMIAELDYELLPTADTLVYFDVDEATWRGFLVGRGRVMDSEALVAESYRTGPYFRAAAEGFAGDMGARLVVVPQVANVSIREVALGLQETLGLAAG
jgi:hypothetical protein